MRILVTSILDLRRVGHNRLHSLLKHLSANHQVTVLCLNAWWLDRPSKAETDYDTDPYFAELAQRVHMKYLYERRVSPVLQELLSVMEVGDTWRSLQRHRFDVHLNYCNLLAGYAISRQACRAGIPTVFDVADDLPHAMRVSPQIPWALRPLAEHVARWLLRRNACIAKRITVSSGSLYRSRDLPSDKVALVPNGVDTEMFIERPADRLRQRLGLEGCFVLGFVGALREWVDLKTVFAAVASLGSRHPDLRLLVVGEEGGLQGARHDAVECRVAGQVIFAGQVPYSQVPLYMSAIDVGLIPFHPIAISEGALPLKLLEYMACGRPVISTPLSGVANAVGERVLYAVGREGWSNSIVRLCEDAPMRARMAAESREFVVKHYSWSAICQRFEALLQEVASGSPGQET